MRASSVPKRQCTLAPSRLRSAAHAFASRRSVPSSGSLRLRHCLTSAEISISAMFSHEPCTGVRVNELDASGQPASPLGVEGLVEGRLRVGGEVVQHHAYLLGLRVILLGDAAHRLGELLLAPPLGDLDAAPPRQGLEGDVDVAGATPAVLLVVDQPSAACGSSGARRQRLAHLGEQLAGPLVEADSGPLRVGRAPRRDPVPPPCATRKRRSPSAGSPTP
jgi:hypothetical protein